MRIAQLLRIEKCFRGHLKCCIEIATPTNSHPTEHNEQKNSQFQMFEFGSCECDNATATDSPHTRSQKEKKPKYTAMGYGVKWANRLHFHSLIFFSSTVAEAHTFVMNEWRDTWQNKNKTWSSNYIKIQSDNFSDRRVRIICAQIVLLHCTKPGAALLPASQIKWLQIWHNWTYHINVISEKIISYFTRRCASSVHAESV